MCLLVRNGTLQTNQKRDTWQKAHWKVETRVCTVNSTERQTTKGEVPTIEELTIKETKDAYCCGVSTQVGLSRSAFQTDRSGCLDWTSKIDVCLPKVVPVSLRELVFCSEHYPPIAAHTGKRPIYDTMRFEFFWANVVSDVDMAASNCETCARSGKLLKRKRHMQVFPAAETL